MKKILKKEVIIAFIIGIILASSIAVYAYSYAAKDISYTKPGTDTTINVETALNDLYSKNVQPFIWKNETHEAMSAQTISCDISKYKHAFVLLEYSGGNRYTGLTSMYTFDITIDKAETISATNGDSNITASRTITFRENGIEISLASYSGALSGSNDTGLALIDAIILY